MVTRGAGVTSTAALSATFAALPSTSIDLCAKYGVKPGDDITTALQSAINTIAASGQSGDIWVSKVGTYLINGAPQTGSVTVTDPEVPATTATYAYNGQILFPARNFFGTSALAITIRGPVRPNAGVDQTGAPQGVIFQSNATSGYVFDTVPAQAHWEWQWTGVMPIFENVVIRVATNPTCGGINMECALRTKLDGVSVDVVTGMTYPSAGTKEAIVLPHFYNNGDVTLRDVNVRGFPVGIKISEHNVLDNVNVIACGTAFSSVGGGHTNWFGYVDVEETPVIFNIAVPPSHPLLVFGHLDTENIYTTGPYAVGNTFVTGTGIIQGKLDLNITNSAPWSQGALGTVMKQLDLANVGQGQGAGWRNMNVKDTFQRLMNLPITGAVAPGLAWPTLHPWRTKAGAWTVSANKLIGTNATRNLAIVSPRDPYGSRVVSATVTTGTTGYNAAVVVARTYDNDTGIWVRLNNGNLTCSVGYAANFASVSGVVAASTTYTVDVAVYYDRGAPKLVKVYLNGVLRVTYTPTSADITALTGSTTYPYADDGLETKDTTSSFSAFEVKDASLVADSPSEVRITGSAMMIANGGPNTVVSGGLWPCWQLDQTASEGVAGEVKVPTDWNTYNILFEVYNPSASATGDCVMRTLYVNRGPGDSNSASFNNSPDVTFTPAAQNVLQEVLIQPNATLTAGKTAISVRADRQAAAAGDTFNSDIALSAIILRRVT